jgi:hypothetical protein
MTNFEPYTNPYKDQLFGYEYRFFTEKSVYQNFLEQINQYKLGTTFYDSLNIIFKSRFWEKRGFDGKTFVKNNYAGNISDFFHDMPSRMGFGCKENDVIYLYLELKSSRYKFWALLQYHVVRTTTPFFNLRDYLLKRRKPKPQWLKDLYIETKMRLKAEYKIMIK